ncbi:hypothetical protein TRVL_02666 [Trypanosoma vivax]|nr:hypothetical protein TRVL_02666 [Trypanosoma vivax]
MCTGTETVFLRWKVSVRRGLYVATELIEFHPLLCPVLSGKHKILSIHLSYLPHHIWGTAAPGGPSRFGGDSHTKHRPTASSKCSPVLLPLSFVSAAKVVRKPPREKAWKGSL